MAFPALALIHTFCMCCGYPGVIGLLVWGGVINETKTTEKVIRHLYCQCSSKLVAKNIHWTYLQRGLFSWHSRDFSWGSQDLSTWPEALGRFHGNQIDHGSAFHLYGTLSANGRPRSSQRGLWLVQRRQLRLRVRPAPSESPVVTTTWWRVWQEIYPDIIDREQTEKNINTCSSSIRQKFYWSAYTSSRRSRKFPKKFWFLPIIGIL